MGEDRQRKMRKVSVNLLGTYLISKYSLEVLKKGCIINIASNNVYEGSYIESIDYDASKAGVISLTHSLARFLAPNIRVNAVAPGWILTDMTKDLDLNFKKCEEDKILLKRFGKSEEIADAVYFLASNEYVNEIDINTLKKIATNRDEYRKLKELEDTMVIKRNKIIERKEEVKEEKIRDINELIEKARGEREKLMEEW